MGTLPPLTLMDPAISWLVRLGVDQGLFTVEQAKAVRAKLGDDAELIDFAQELIDDGYVADEVLGELEALAGKALQEGAKGPPALDPFDAPVRAKPKLAMSPTEPAPPPRAPAPAPMPPPSVALQKGCGSLGGVGEVVLGVGGDLGSPVVFGSAGEVVAADDVRVIDEPLHPFLLLSLGRAERFAGAVDGPVECGQLSFVSSRQRPGCPPGPECLEFGGCLVDGSGR